MIANKATPFTDEMTKRRKKKKKKQ